MLGFSRPANQAAAADFSQNFFSEQPWTYGYNFQMVRIDHEWSSDQHTYGRFIRNFRREERYNFAGELNGVEITRGLPIASTSTMRSVTRRCSRRRPFSI